MANSSRDPYWQASVRRETIDHPSKKAEIEDECSICHMPMARNARPCGRRARPGLRAPARGTRPVGRRTSGCRRRVLHALPSDQPRAPRHARELHRRLRRRTRRRMPGAAIFGPFRVDPGRTRIMHSATGVTPTEATHIQQSELCATCHTLVHQGARTERRGHRRAARAGAVPRVAAQRLSSRAELPVVPHACGRPSRRRSRPCSASRGQVWAGTRSSAATSSCCGC